MAPEPFKPMPRNDTTCKELRRDYKRSSMMHAEEPKRKKKASCSSISYRFIIQSTMLECQLVCDRYVEKHTL